MRRALLIVIFGLTFWLSGFATPDQHPMPNGSEWSSFDYSLFLDGVLPNVSILDLQLIPLTGKVQIRWTGQDLEVGMKVLIERKSDNGLIQLVGGLTYRMPDMASYQFSFEDRDPLEVKQVSYRVIHVYPDGQRILSDWQSLIQASYQQARAFPNPTTDQIQFNWVFSTVSELQVKLMTVTGQDVSQMQHISAQGFSAVYVVSTTALQPGTYLLYATDGRYHWASRFAKR